MTTDITPLTSLPDRITQTTRIEQSRAVAEVQAAIFVAQQFPRDMQRAWAEMRDACKRLGLASRAFYAVPNRGSGKSIHLAVELARIWGNIDYGVKELHRSDERGESEVLAHAWDQQTNTRSTRSLIVPHARMVKKDRVSLTDLSDIYLNNQNVGARAMRECLFKVMPADFAAEAEDICRATLEKGDGQPLDKRIETMVAAFVALGTGIDVGRMEARVGRKRGLWTAVDVSDLGIVYSSLRRGDVTAEDAFPPVRVTAEEIVARKPTARVAAIARVKELFEQVGMVDLMDQARYMADILGKDVGGPAGLTLEAAPLVIAALERYAAQDEPPAESAGGAS